MRRLLLTLALCLVPSVASAQNFIYNNTSLPGPKVNARPITGPANQNLSAPDWNTAMQALYDVRTFMYLTPAIWYYGGTPGLPHCDGATDDSATMVAALGAIHLPATLRMDGCNMKLASSITIPHGLTVDMGNGAFTIGQGQVLNVAGRIEAPPVHIFFYTAGDQAPVQFGGPWNPATFPLLGTDQERDYPQWFGAPVTYPQDDAIATQAAVNAWGFSDAGLQTGSGGEVKLTSGQWTFKYPVTLGQGFIGGKFHGNGSGDVYGMTAISCKTYDAGAPLIPCISLGAVNTGVESAAIAIDIGYFDATGDIDAGPVLALGEAGNDKIHDVSFSQFNMHAPIVSMIASPNSQNQIQNISFENTIFALGNNYAAPAIYIEANDGWDVSEMDFENLLILGQGNGPTQGTVPQIEMHANCNNLCCGNITFGYGRSEEPAGGLLVDYGCQNVEMRHFIDADLIAPPTRPIIDLERGGDGGLAFVNANSNNFRIDQCEFFDGTNQNPCIKISQDLNAGFVAPIILNTFCYGPIELGPSSRPVLIGSGFNAGISDGGTPTNGPLNLTANGAGFSGVLGISASGTVWSDNLTNPVNTPCVLSAGQSSVVCTAGISSTPEQDDKYHIMITEMVPNTDAGFETLAFRVIPQPGDGGLGDGNSRQFTIQASGTASFDHTFNWFLVRGK